MWGRSRGMNRGAKSLYQVNRAVHSIQIFISVHTHCTYLCAISQARTAVAFSSLRHALPPPYQREASKYFYGKRGHNDFFVIRHFAGDVTYDVHGFIEHNRDRLPEQLRMLMQTSHHPLMQELYPSSANNGAAEDDHVVHKQQQDTIVSGFRTQLTTLARTLAMTVPHYMKCIKPNSVQMRPVDGLVAFDEHKVYQQLLFAGVMELYEIRNKGFMFRESYPDFWRRCVRGGIADLSDLPEDMDPRKGTLAICNAALPIFDQDSHERPNAERAQLARAGLRHVKDAAGGSQRGRAFWVAGHTMLLGKASTLEHLREYKVGKLSHRVRVWWRQRAVTCATVAFARAMCVIGTRWRKIYLRRRAAVIKDDVLVLQRVSMAVLAVTHMRERRHYVLSAQILQQHWRTFHVRQILAAMARRLRRFDEVSAAAGVIQRAARHQIAR